MAFLDSLSRFFKSFTFKQVFSVLCLLVIALILFTVYSQGLQLINLDKFGKWLREAGTADVARGLITATVVFATVIIAISLVGFVIFGKRITDDKTQEKRFNQGLQVLTLFMGILGTIMGFYYAEGTVQVKDVKNLTGADSSKAITLAELENKGWRALQSLNFEGVLDAFSDAEKDEAHSPIIDRVLELLEPVKEDFANEKDEDKRNDLWKPILCKIKDDNGLADIPADIKEDLDGTIQGMACPTPTPTPEPISE